MDYELAKQLKDAGFPQKSNFGSFFYDAEGNQWLENLKIEKRPEKECAAPTLEELIEACGMDFLSLRHYLAAYWEADGLAETEVEKTTRGATPTEAIARLWLTLNAKTV